MNEKREYLTFVVHGIDRSTPGVSTFWPNRRDENHMRDLVDELQSIDGKYEIIKVAVPDKLKPALKALDALNELTATEEMCNHRVAELLGEIVLAVRRNIKQIK